MSAPEFFAVDTGEVTLNCAALGAPGKPLVICLHGFPEYWAAWRAVMEALCKDFRLVAPDQRGFNLSSKPEGVDSYRARHMVADLDKLAEQLSPDQPFVLAGHDWGASVAYAYAFARPERVSHLIIANGVHPAVFQRAIFEDEGQRAASQYINTLRAEGAEARMAADGYRRTLRMIEGFSKTDWMTPETRSEYVAAWSQPGAMTAMLNWYRASPIIVPEPGAPSEESFVLTLPDEAVAVRMPHLVLWGEDDEALRPACVEGLPRYAPSLVVRRVPGAGHWILHEKPALVAQAIREFVATG
ncbi:alpha/beta fold hydrolase [Nitratireductor mangrovi]|uniref:Alpha/beta fold hydrolase n=1 Tax=Nitratireductor mangrovi TaxID=2599600 RepID=A0A5B8KVF9_9HYPH|nr:alpha/beta fold hydrolase [Nitratireductor mangrovi]QDY99575.2 alpha/beta fold hydrolase [Nitratireductor mangrovi]